MVPFRPVVNSSFNYKSAPALLLEDKCVLGLDGDLAGVADSGGCGRAAGTSSLEWVTRVFEELNINTARGGGGGSGGCSSRGDASSTKQQPAFSKSELEDLVSKFASEMRVGL